MLWEKEEVLRPITPCSSASMVSCAIYVSGGVFFSHEGFIIYRSTGMQLISDPVVLKKYIRSSRLWKGFFKERID